MRFILFFLILFPFLAFAGNLSCTANFTNPATPLKITVFQTEVTNFNDDLSFKNKVDGTDYLYVITTGNTQDIMDDPDEPTHIGKPTLRSLVVYNSTKSQIARFDVPLSLALPFINLTVGSEEDPSRFRLHISCRLN